MRRSSDWDNIGLSCRLNRLNKHSRWDKWQDKVSFCLLIRFNWRVPARVPLFSLGLKAHRSGPCGHSGRLSEVVLTHYRRREVRNSIYRYREIHIDYRSKFSYRFISFISIIYGNTSLDYARGLSVASENGRNSHWSRKPTIHCDWGNPSLYLGQPVTKRWCQLPLPSGLDCVAVYLLPSAGKGLQEQVKRIITSKRCAFQERNLQDGDLQGPLLLTWINFNVSCCCCQCDSVVEGIYFNWPFVRESTGHLWFLLTKGQWYISFLCSTLGKTLFSHR